MGLQRLLALFCDANMLAALHLFLVGLLAAALTNTARAGWRLRQGALNPTAVRGERSMNSLYVIYGLTTVAITLAVDVSTAGVGSKTFLVMFDYAALLYLFFFNSWFRNRLFVFSIGSLKTRLGLSASIRCQSSVHRPSNVPRRSEECTRTDSGGTSGGAGKLALALETSRTMRVQTLDLVVAARELRRAAGG